MSDALNDFLAAVAVASTIFAVGQGIIVPWLLRKEPTAHGQIVGRQFGCVFFVIVAALAGGAWALWI